MKTRATLDLRKYLSNIHLKAGLLSVIGQAVKMARYPMAISLMVMPPLLVLIFIITFGVNVPYWDQWEFVPLFDKLYTGNLSLSDLFAQHNEHRILFPRLSMLFLGHFSSFNTILEMAFSWLIICLGTVLLLFVHVSESETRLSTFLTFAPVSWLLFSLRQEENFLWGWQIQFFLCVLFSILAFYFLDRIERSVVCIFLAIISGFFASFSFSSGLLVWPVGMIQLFFVRFKNTDNGGFRCFKFPWWNVYVWFIASLAVYIIYFWDYTKPGHHPGLSFFFYNPLEAFFYFLAFLGSPFSGEKNLSITFGSITFVIYFYVILSLIFAKVIRISWVWVSMMFYALASGIILVLGRSGFGITQALSSRYATFAIVGLVGLYMTTLVLNFLHPFVKRTILGLLLLFVAISTYGSLRDGFTTGNRSRYTRNIAALHLQTFMVDSDRDLVALYPHTLIVRERAAILQKYELSVFRQGRWQGLDPRMVGRSALFHVDEIDGRPVAVDGKEMRIGRRAELVQFRGWAVDEKAGTAAGGVVLRIDDDREIDAHYGLRRDDVAEFFKNPRYQFTGFEGAIPKAMLGKGKHTVRLKIVTADKQGYYDVPRPLNLVVR